MKMFVLSASEFKSQKAALNRIKHWEETKKLKKDLPFVYEVVKKYRPVRVWKLQPC